MLFSYLKKILWMIVELCQSLHNYSSTYTFFEVSATLQGHVCIRCFGSIWLTDRSVCTSQMCVRVCLCVCVCVRVCVCACACACMRAAAHAMRASMQTFIPQIYNFSSCLQNYNCEEISFCALCFCMCIRCALVPDIYCRIIYDFFHVNLHYTF